MCVIKEQSPIATSFTGLRAILICKEHLILFFEDQSGLEEAIQMRRDFVANVSHELKTPLTSLIGFIETLQTAAKNDPAAREQFLSIMKNEAQRMDRLIANLLSLSQVEASERLRPTQLVNLKDVIGESIEALTPMIEKSSKNETEPSQNISHVTGEYDQLRQVFMNLEMRSNTENPRSDFGGYK